MTTHRERMHRAAVYNLAAKYFAEGMSEDEALWRAEDEAQVEYDRYCDDLMDERRLERGQ